MDDTSKIATINLGRKLTDLEEKAVNLEKEFDRIIQRTAEIELWVKQYEKKMIVEKRMIGLLHILVRPGDKRATVLLNHLSVFFNDVLTRLENNGMRYNNLEFLHRDISQEAVSSALKTVLKEMGFTDNEIEDIKLVIELGHSRIRRMTKLEGAYELHCSKDNPMHVPQEISVFLQLRDELDEPMRTLLKKIVFSCYREGEELTTNQNN